MNRTEVRDLLLEAADSAYKEFNDKLANCDTAPSIGVRVPEIRRIAKEAVKNGWEEYLSEMETLAQMEDLAGLPLLQEEHMLQGIVIGSARMTDEARVQHLDRWVPGILSWADCDCSVSSMKFMKKNQDFWFAYNTGWLMKKGGDSGKASLIRPFTVRFALVALMQYFINDTYIDRVLELFAFPFGRTEANASPVKEDGQAADVSRMKENGQAADMPRMKENGQAAGGDDYYIRMAQAWALSVCFVKYRDKTLRLLEERCMDAWVQNKAIQKCRESYRVSAEDKELLKLLKI
ncbi:MAG: DNA alkylation repair protein [Lachnospiraceae bacterium]|nr:DNA alkylation repair protein [Lachnospiraceae bacterium]